jgi:hypothetical protein
LGEEERRYAQIKQSLQVERNLYTVLLHSNRSGISAKDKISGYFDEEMIEFTSLSCNDKEELSRAEIVREY